MITVPFTQMHMFVSMLISEVFLLSDPNYSVKIGNENYFSLAVAGLVALVFLIGFIAIKFGSKIQFKEYVSNKPAFKQNENRKQTQLIKVVAK